MNLIFGEPACLSTGRRSLYVNRHQDYYFTNVEGKCIHAQTHQNITSTFKGAAFVSRSILIVVEDDHLKGEHVICYTIFEYTHNEKNGEEEVKCMNKYACRVKDIILSKTGQCIDSQLFEKDAIVTVSFDKSIDGPLNHTIYIRNDNILLVIDYLNIYYKSTVNKINYTHTVTLLLQPEYAPMVNAAFLPIRDLEGSIFHLFGITSDGGKVYAYDYLDGLPIEVPHLWLDVLADKLCSAWSPPLVPGRVLYFLYRDPESTLHLMMYDVETLTRKDHVIQNRCRYQASFSLDHRGVIGICYLNNANRLVQEPIILNLSNSL